jgi:hypothetical protein
MTRFDGMLFEVDEQTSRGGSAYCVDLGGLILFAIEHIGQYPMNPVNAIRMPEIANVRACIDK